MLLNELQDLVFEPELFYDHLIKIGSPEPEYDIRTPDNYTPGCQSSVWVFKDNDDNILVDADSYLVRGIARVIADFEKHNGTVVMGDFRSITKPLTVQRQRGMQSIINKVRVIRGIPGALSN